MHHNPYEYTHTFKVGYLMCAVRDRTLFANTVDLPAAHCNVKDVTDIKFFLMSNVFLRLIMISEDIYSFIFTHKKYLTLK